jgi:DNA polymerase
MRTEGDLLDVYEAYRSSKHFAALRKAGLPLVQGAGPITARVMVVGEAPGASEVNSGVPFTGRSGAVLNQLLAIAGISRRETFLTTVVKYRTPGNRPPSASEVMRSAKFLRKEWMIVRPLLTIALGTSAQAAMEVEDLHHGAIVPFWYDNASGINHMVAAVYHPAFALKNKKARAWVEKEWKLLRDDIREFVPESTISSVS